MQWQELKLQLGSTTLLDVVLLEHMNPITPEQLIFKERTYSHFGVEWQPGLALFRLKQQK